MNEYEKQKVNLNTPKTKRNSLNMILINIDKQKLLNGILNENDVNGKTRQRRFTIKDKMKMMKWKI